MAKIHFLKPGQQSIKGSISSGVYRKRWKLAFIISGVINVLFLGIYYCMCNKLWYWG